MRAQGTALIVFALVVAACGGDGDDPPADAGVTTEHCSYEPVAPTANAGGTVAAGTLRAGTAERVLHVPIGTALGGYTGRAGFISSAGAVDARKVKLPGTFNPSIGVTAAPRVKALALEAGGETVLIVKADLIFTYEGMLFDLEARLGDGFRGKVVLAASHSHSAWAQFTGHSPLKLGAGELRALVYGRILDDLEGAARDALAELAPAKLGVFASDTFDRADVINRDRRGDNDRLPGGDRGDEHLYLLRVDRADGSPLAIVPVFGEHGTLNGEDNPFASTDAPGAVERALEEQFDEDVLVMHLQGAGADTSPVDHGAIDCAVKPGRASDPCFTWAVEEGHGRAAVPELMAAWASAGADLRASLELEMLTRSIETGPDPETFSIRGGALTYAAFDPTHTPDGLILDDDAVASPIDEFNAPVGAALCEVSEPMFPAAAIPGTEGMTPYGSCLRLDAAAEILEPIFAIDFGVDETHPVCETTRTTISALRIGDFVIATLPGEVSVLLADLVRAKSPVGAKTIVVGYAQGHVGYMMRPEDWVLGGYEASVTFWGPLEAEMIVERALELVPLALTAEREDGAAAGTTRVATATPPAADLPIDDPAPLAGTVPAMLPEVTWARTGIPAQAQPAAEIPRVAGIATFVWVGDDPQVRTPHVTLEVEDTPGSFVPVRRRSGRIVDDAELVLAYTPSPLQRSGPQTHLWVVEWQAVPWLGAVGLDELGARGGVPLGTYRFRVEGKGWTLTSNPFDVVPGGLVATAQRQANGIRVVASWHAPKGWRLMHATLLSNQPVPVTTQPVTVALLGAGNTVLSTAQVTTDASGVATVPDNALAQSVRVTDRFGNVTTVSVQP